MTSVKFNETANDKLLLTKVYDILFTVIQVKNMVLKLYRLIASPPVRSVLMVIEALKIPDVEYVDVNLLDGSHLKDEYLKVTTNFITALHLKHSMRKLNELIVM